MGHANAASWGAGTEDNPEFAAQRQKQKGALTTEGAGAYFVDPNVYRANENYASKDYAVSLDGQPLSLWRCHEEPGP